MRVAVRVFGKTSICRHTQRHYYVRELDACPASRREAPRPPLSALEGPGRGGLDGGESVAIRPNGAIRRQLRTLFNLGAIGELSDGQLLERFATQGGEAAELAFAALVERHGPMVLRVCRKTLRDPNDVQDA